MTKTYIGDGVYVNYDGYQLELTTDRGGLEETIYLEPQVFKALLVYVRNLNLEAYSTLLDMNDD